jgi:hypothetical protein
VGSKRSNKNKEMSKNIIFITEQLFKERTGASNQIDAKQLFPMIKVAQDVYIQPALGSTLYNRLQFGVDGNNLNANETYLIDNYITDALIWYTMSMLPMTMGFQLFSKGFLQKSSEESNTPSRGDLELIEQKYLSMAEFYKTRMIRYLQENYSLFYEYLNTTLAIDTIYPENKGYTCPIWLGNGYQSGPTYVNSQSSSASMMYVYYTAVGNETTFQVNALVGRTTIFAARSGLVKLITTQPTNDTNYLQIVNGTITLPVGDLAMAGEVFTFIYR